MTCDECGCTVIGVRWHALHKDDFDLCDACHSQLPPSGDGDSGAAYLRVIQSAAPTTDAGVSNVGATATVGDDEPAQKRARPE